MFSYRPNLPVSFISHELGFPTEKECKEFLTAHGVMLKEGDPSQIDPKGFYFILLAHISKLNRKE